RVLFRSKVANRRDYLEIRGDGTHDDIEADLVVAGAGRAVADRGCAAVDGELCEVFCLDDALDADAQRIHAAFFVIGEDDIANPRLKQLAFRVDRHVFERAELFGAFLDERKLFIVETARIDRGRNDIIAELFPQVDNAQRRIETTGKSEDATWALSHGCALV